MSTALYVDALVAATDEFIYQQCRVGSSSKHAWWWRMACWIGGEDGGAGWCWWRKSYFNLPTGL
jgi:hypothetical protein